MRNLSGLRVASAGGCEIYGSKADMIENDKRKYIEGAIFLVLFCLTIPAANWMIGHVGTVCVPNGPCLVPVAPGLLAPSGVLMVGAALVLRDLVQRRLGVEFGVGAIVVGAAISAGLGPPPPRFGLATAVFLSEFSHFSVFHPPVRPPAGAGMCGRHGR